MKHLRIESAVIGDRPASVQERAGARAASDADAAEELRRLGCMLCGAGVDGRAVVDVQKVAGRLVAVCWGCQAAHGLDGRAFRKAAAAQRGR